MRESPFAAAIRLAEESLSLARSVGLSAFFIYLVGVVPFFAILIAQVSALVQSPTAFDRLVGGSLALALSFLWMQACQSLYSAYLIAEATDTELHWRPAYLLRTA